MIKQQNRELAPADHNRTSFLEAGVDPHVLHSVTFLAEELAKYGCEGRHVGTLFVIGDASEVLERSQPLILDPLTGHDDSAKNVQSPVMQNTMRELALLDGAFVITATGTVVSAARCLDVSTRDVEVPLGFGSRHVAAASITNETEALAIVVSQGSHAVRTFHDGVLVDEIQVEPAQPASAPIAKQPSVPTLQGSASTTLGSPAPTPPQQRHYHPLRPTRLPPAGPEHRGTLRVYA